MLTLESSLHFFYCIFQQTLVLFPSFPVHFHLHNPGFQPVSLEENCSATYQGSPWCDKQSFFFRLWQLLSSSILQCFRETGPIICADNRKISTHTLPPFSREAQFGTFLCTIQQGGHAECWRVLVPEFLLYNKIECFIRIQPTSSLVALVLCLPKHSLGGFTTVYVDMRCARSWQRQTGPMPLFPGVFVREI